MRLVPLLIALGLLQACASVPHQPVELDPPSAQGRFVLFGAGLATPIQGRFEWWPARPGANPVGARLAIADPWGQPQGELTQAEGRQDWAAWSIRDPGGKAVSPARAQRWAAQTLGIEPDQLDTLGALLGRVAQELSIAANQAGRIEASLPSQRGPLAIRVLPDPAHP